MKSETLMLGDSRGPSFFWVNNFLPAQSFSESRVAQHRREVDAAQKEEPSKPPGKNRGRHRARREREKSVKRRKEFEGIEVPPRKKSFERLLTLFSLPSFIAYALVRSLPRFSRRSFTLGYSEARAELAAASFYTALLQLW